MKMKKGVPKNAVIAPTGSSDGGNNIRPIVSHVTTKIPPSKADDGISFFKSAPKNNRSILGIINPTKPIIPEDATQTAIIIMLTKIVVILTLLVEIPRLFASESPKDIIFKSLAKEYKIKIPISTTGIVTVIFRQLEFEKLPTDHIVIAVILS